MIRREEGGYRRGRRSYRKRIQEGLRGKDEGKIRFTRNTLLNSLPIEKFRTRVPYNFSLDSLIRVFLIVFSISGFSISFSC